jgi:hypothetical protein
VADAVSTILVPKPDANLFALMDVILSVAVLKITD